MSDKRPRKTDDEIREIAAGISRDYFDLMNHLRDARAALTRAEQTLDLIGPNDLPRHVALDDLVLSIQASAEMIGQRTGTDVRRPGGRMRPGVTGADPGRAELHGELDRLTAQRRAWDETTRACVCTAGLCSRSEFRDHQGDSPGCMVCADLDPDQPCYAAVIATLEAGEKSAASDGRVPLESEGLRQVQAYLDRTDDRDPEAGK